ncbi:hypothetical protein MLD38_002955 [Melastoma candidum]|uniref:Uncharacterized protein n=1 Tax=Melastoma candidum TaxID=119954 RepID=A0ACB9S093_9MYRT|nr:hypothetical protein MLD38_002955 [Melastoma candidum]
MARTSTLEHLSRWRRTSKILVRCDGAFFSQYKFCTWSCTKREEIARGNRSLLVENIRGSVNVEVRKCKGRSIQKLLTTEEAVEAMKGLFQRSLFNKSLEFWQCMDCKQIYWEGTQYHNASPDQETSG